MEAKHLPDAARGQGSLSAALAPPPSFFSCPILPHSSTSIKAFLPESLSGVFLAGLVQGLQEALIRPWLLGAAHLDDASTCGRL